MTPPLEATDPYQDQAAPYRQGNAVGDPLRLQGADPYSRQGLTVDPYGQPTGRYAPYYPGASRGAPYGMAAIPPIPIIEASAFPRCLFEEIGEAEADRRLDAALDHWAPGDIGDEVIDAASPDKGEIGGKTVKRVHSRADRFDP